MKKLNFGCGEDIREGYDNVDIQEYPKLTKSFDFDKFPYPIKDDTYDYIYCEEVLEHLTDVEKVLYELLRIAKPNAIIEILVPYYNNKGAFSSLQHKHYFSEVAFKVFVDKYKELNKKKYFDMEYLNVIPTVVGKWIRPRWFRCKLALFLGGIASRIHIKLRVIK